ncbi:WD repeat-containing protein pop2 [Talaromyces islandicus]|uniref:WD repeat-containing protein pop2 n=1 Tax=Talaromyces islandicus TaxID=28573 RepID=A0A0U1M8L1_TALIS|nr:WD repeat-containing protein pop2 [Talaromyces islandicus]
MHIQTIPILAEPISNTGSTAVVTALLVAGEYIAIALDDSEIHVFALDGSRKHSLNGSQGAVWTIAMHGKLLCTGGGDSTIRIWDLLTGNQIHVLAGHTSTIRALLFLDNTTLVSGSRDGSIRIWDVETGQCKQVLDSHHTATVRCLAGSSSQSNVFVSGGYDGKACIWPAFPPDKIECLQSLSGHDGGIYTMALTDDGKLVVTGGLDAVLRVWDVRSGKCSAELHGHKSLITKIQILQDRRLIISSDSTGSIHAWSLTASHTLIYATQTHDNSVTSFDTNNSQRVIISGGADGAVKLSDPQTGQVLGRLVRDGEAVWKVAFVGDGRAVAAISRDGRSFIEMVEFGQ